MPNYAGKHYGRGFDSGFASDADYADGFTVSDSTIGQMALDKGISEEQARRRLTGMSRLEAMLARQDEGREESGYDFGLDA